MDTRIDEDRMAEPQMAGASPHVEVEGDENTVYATGGDLFVGGSHVHHDAREDFVRLTLERLRLTSAPREAPRMVEMLRGGRMLLLGGSYDDKPTVARQVAAMLAGGGAPLPVLEWNRGSDVPGLLAAIQTRTERSVLLLTAIEPRHVRHDLEGVSKAAGHAGHFILVTTDVPASAWRLSEHEASLWITLEPGGLFDGETLVGELVRHLWAARDALGDVFREAHASDRCTVAGVPLGELAETLHTPPIAAGFVQQLVSRVRQGARVDEAAVRELAQASVRRDLQVQRWFHGVLRPREQLLALCLSFFDGLIEDQFFAALERWVSQIREARDPSIRAFDYGDLDNLSLVFDTVEESGGMRFESRSADERAVLLHAAWKTHRREILGAMGVLTGLVSQSPYGRGTDWELYGSRGRRAHLRRVVAAALSDLGVISETSVERALLRLAGDGNAEVQGVAASAVARWRLHGRDAQLFRLLDRWQKDARIRSMVEALMEGKEKVRSAEAHIRSTVALAVGYAVEYDAPNQLHERLVTLLRDLASDTNSVVRRRFTGVTLPRAVALHVTQLRPLLRDIAGWKLEEDVANALAYAAKTAPREVLDTLLAWHAECDGLRRDTVDRRRTGVRETLLRTLAYTYGALDYDPAGPFRAEDGFQRLRQMLATENHPAVRDAVVDAMIRQARERFGAVEALLQRTIENVAPGERDDVVRRLVEVYLGQREAMTGGNAHVTVNGRSYPAFVGLSRALVPVEVAMMRWMRDPAHPAAQRVAVRALFAFADALDGPEGVQVARIAANRRARAAEAGQHRISSTPVGWGEERAGWYAGTLVPWLATSGEPRLRPVVAGLLPEVLRQRIARPTAVEFSLGRWETMDDAAMQSTARGLRSAMSWHANAGILLFLGGGALFFILMVLLIATL